MRSLASLRRLPPRTAWLLLAADLFQLSGIALVTIPLALGIDLLWSAIFAVRGQS